MEQCAQPSGGGRGNWKNFASTQAEEDAYDYVKFRVNPKPTGFVGSVAHAIKGALGGGILGGHVAFMKAGLIAAPCVFLFGVYMTYCLYMLVTSAQILFRRTRVSSMSYPDVGEAAMACFPNPSVAKWATAFRYSMDAIICIDLFGACACYQLIIAKSIKQLVENTQHPTMEGLGPVLCVLVTIYYAMQFNPSMSGLKVTTTAYSYFEFIGMSVFSMSCVGVVLPIENNMGNPKNFPKVLVTGKIIRIDLKFVVLRLCNI
ncbi:proton-coupled amino acid transporter-like protein pathetic [Bicyclus anynana]|uniref:Proton-coupled amino acid transporter-like protein pathetic n=1 Tax=Bicyclus anynana TaxID=110368 RepID=A0ABM3LV24_BICAN|nr:proton-coupled amino acid transporter-like protein pathetic [Bicyclus anynana]